jgi:hypothetical protein
MTNPFINLATACENLDQAQDFHPEMKERRFAFFCMP